MYQWRKFQFFEEKALGASAKQVIQEMGSIACSSSGRGQIVLGSQDGVIHVLDRGFKLTHSFQAHSISISFLQQLKQRNMIISVGEDETTSSQVSSMSLKLWDLTKFQDEGTSTSAPVCVRALRVFSPKFPEAKVTSFLVHEEAPPILLICFGLETGVVYCIRGDVGRERLVWTKLSVDPSSSAKPASPVTGFGLRVDGPTLELFAVTTASVNLYNMQQNPPPKHVLDEHGCDGHCVTMSDQQELVIGRPEALYFYEVDGRGPCWAFEGDKKYVGWFRGYLVTVMSDASKNIFNIYDLRSKLIAYSAPVDEVAHVLCEWGVITILTHTQKIVCIVEKDVNSKLELLYRKNLYPVAISLVQRQQADAAATAQVLRKYGDHLYSKQDYDEAMQQYVRTIGQLEPSFVIQKFLDTQLIQNLTHYLEKLHEKGLGTADHTTLLLNCYTKLKDVTKLDKFIKGDGQSEGEHRFDVETAVRVCRAAGYHEHAMYVARRAGEHEWYLKILLEDLGSYEEGLQYIAGLPLREAVVTLKQYGKKLVQHKPGETTAALMKLCTYSLDAASSSNSSSAAPSPMDFVHIYVDQPRWLVVFLEQYLAKVAESSFHKAIHNTLLEIYLSEKLPSAKAAKQNEEQASSAEKALVKKSKTFKDAVITEKKDGDDETGEQKASRLQKANSLLKKGWPPHEQEPQYDAALAVMLCEKRKFRDGLLFLYEKKKLYREIMACYMKDGDHQGLISCCKRLADMNRGGDPMLWADVLAYFGEGGQDCSLEVKEVLVYIERDNLLPPLVVLQTLAKNPALSLSVVKNYIARQLQEESRQIEEDRTAIQKYEEETSAMRAEINELKSKPRIFQLSKCTSCTSTLDLPAVHFLCMHSFHQRCLGDNERECPVCAPANHTMLEMKRNLSQNASDHDRFFQLVRNSDDGFSVIADYFGRGMLGPKPVA